MPPSPAPYHHGALRQALIDATEALLAEKGADGFSLREVARRAGVSAAAPAHHFGDAAGLMTAVATRGFEGLTQALEAGDARGADARAALREQGIEYVRYALDHPGRFRLMFRSGQLHKDAALDAQGMAAFEVLARGVRRLFGVADAASMTPEHWHAVTALWSLVHGYAHLAIAGKLDPLCRGQGLKGFVAGSLSAILTATIAGLVPGAPLTAGRARPSSRQSTKERA